MSRAALSVERVRYDRAHDSLTASRKPFGSSPEESRSYRGKQRRENKEEQETELVLINTGKAAAGGKPTSHLGEAHPPYLRSGSPALNSERTLPSIGSPPMNLKECLVRPFPGL